MACPDKKERYRRPNPYRGNVGLSLLPGRYFGSSLRQVMVNDLILTLSRYSDVERQPWHTHENPTLFLLLRGGLRDRRRQGETHIGPLMLVYHPVDEMHRSEAAPQGMVGLNIEPSPTWLSAHQLSPGDLGPYQALPYPNARLAALRSEACEATRGVKEEPHHAVEGQAIVRGALEAEAKPGELVRHVRDILSGGDAARPARLGELG